MIDQIKASATGFMDFVDNRGVVRRFIMAATIYLAVQTIFWAEHFATTTDKTGIEVAAIIAAITAPVTAMQGWALQVYLQSRQNQ